MKSNKIFLIKIKHLLRLGMVGDAQNMSEVKKHWEQIQLAW